MSGSRGFRWGCGLAALGLVAVCLVIASREWFSRDDFAFLAHVRSADFRWLDAFLPLDARFWPFYRPLGMESYFRACFALFGVQAAGYFAVSLAFHFGSGALVFRIARRLAFDPPAAWVAALLAVSRPAALDQIFYGSVFHFVASLFFTLLSLLCVLAASGPRASGWRLASLGSLALALLCNEVNAVAPLGLACALLAAPGRSGIRPVARELAPHALLVAAFLAFRFGALPAVAASPVYTPSLGPHVLGNLLTLVAESFGGWPTLAAVALLGLACGVWGLRGPAAVGSRRRLARRCVLFGAWLLVAVSPFAWLPFAQPRYAMLAAAPAALACAALAQAAWETAGLRRPRRVEALLVTVVWLALPYGVLLERLEAPRGAQPQALLRAVAARRGSLAPGARLVLLYGGSGLAPRDLGIGLRYLAYNGAVLQAVHPEWKLSLRFHDLSERAPRNVIRPGTVYLQLLPGLEVEDAEAGRLDRELARGTEPTHG